MSTVLWGARRGDVQYGSRAFWRRNIPIDPAVLRVGVNLVGMFDVGDLVEVRRTALVLGYTPGPFRVAGVERDYLGLVRA